MCGIMQCVVSDESYILDLVEALLKEKCIRQCRFDGYFPLNKLIVEYMEKQHSESVPVMDGRMTISGCPRGRQRQIYQDRKRQYAADNGYEYLEVDYREFEFERRNGRLERNPGRDKGILIRLLEEGRIYEQAI